jgi:predicted membrane-bound mannosyltransferase
MKILSFLYFTLCAMFLMATPAHAYIDPSVMTFAVQVIAGVAVAVGAVAGVLWRRAKKKVQDKLGIDENAGKEVEEDVVELDED